MQNPCKCGYVFCVKDRLPETHNCTFDHFAANQKLLMEKNPHIGHEKFAERIWMWASIARFSRVSHPLFDTYSWPRLLVSRQARLSKSKILTRSVRLNARPVRTGINQVISCPEEHTPPSLFAFCLLKTSWPHKSISSFFQGWQY